MLYYAGTMYLYEPSVSYSEIQLELAAYSSIIFGLFWMTTSELKLPFYQFYNIKPITPAEI